MSEAGEAAIPGESTSEISSTALRVAGVAMFPLFTAIAAQVAFPVPPWGIPFTLQSLAVVMCALCLGPKLGAAAMLLYVGAGAIGVPVFSNEGAGLGVILGQNGGYIAGFILCQPVITSIIRRRDGTIRGWGALALSVIAGHMVIFAIGVPVLYFVRNADGSLAPTTWVSAIRYGFVVFVPAMLVKAAIAVWLGRVAAPWAARRVW